MTMPPATQPYSADAAEPTKPLNPLAVVSLITSILPFHLIGIITGHIALVQIKRTGARGRGLALAGVILGYVGCVVVLIIVLLSAIAVPVFLNQQAAARDSAVQSDITNLKIAVVTNLVINPERFPTADEVAELFVAGSDSVLTVSGDVSAFCLEGYSLSNGAGATHYAASDLSGTVPGTCDNGVLLAAP